MHYFIFLFPHLFRFLDLEGPIYTKPPGESLDWVKSIVSGKFEILEILEMFVIIREEDLRVDSLIKYQ